jgi:predicted RNA binding protein YcfA (HicA-like mRNA interferase family)
MAKLKLVDYDKVLKALSKIGYMLDHQKGSHIVIHLKNEEIYTRIYGNRNPEHMIVIPAHKPLARGMLRAIIKNADLSVDEFYELLK